MFVMKEKKEYINHLWMYKYDNSENVCGLISVLLIFTKWHHRPVQPELWLAFRCCRLSRMMVFTGLRLAPFLHVSSSLMAMKVCLRPTCMSMLSASGDMCHVFNHSQGDLSSPEVMDHVIYVDFDKLVF